MRGGEEGGVCEGEGRGRVCVCACVNVKENVNC